MVTLFSKLMHCMQKVIGLLDDHLASVLKSNDPLIVKISSTLVGMCVPLLQSDVSLWRQARGPASFSSSFVSQSTSAYNQQALHKMIARFLPEFSSVMSGVQHIMKSLDALDSLHNADHGLTVMGMLSLSHRLCMTQLL
jgi:hypothetical protein